MSPEFRMVVLVAASLGLLLSLFLVLRPDDENETAPPQTTTTLVTTTEPTPATTAPSPPPEPAGPVLITIDASLGKIYRGNVRKGRAVVLTVRASVSDHVHLHGYDLMADVSPGSPARIRFEADLVGRFEVELEDRGTQIAELTVTP